jgi:hypothetical protein
MAKAILEVVKVVERLKELTTGRQVPFTIAQ